MKGSLLFAVLRSNPCSPPCCAVPVAAAFHQDSHAHAPNPIPPSQNPTCSFTSFNCDGPATIASTSLFHTVDIFCHEFFFFLSFRFSFHFFLLWKRPSVLAVKVRVLSCLCDTLPMRVREGGRLTGGGNGGNGGDGHGSLRLKGRLWAPDILDL